VRSTSSADSEEAAALLTAAAVRERCEIVFAAAERGETLHFRVVSDRLDEAVERVVAVTCRRYPDLTVPYHSRWRHFSVGRVDRAALIAPRAGRTETTRAQIDLAIVSVLLDAGVGAGWRFREAETGQVWSRSEGLAVASLRAMQSGLFSVDAADPWRADAEALSVLSVEKLARAFQHRADNKLIAIGGRAALLRRTGEICAARPDLFGSPPRLGNLFDYWSAQFRDIPAPEILRTLMHTFGPIWPGRLSLGGIPLGDCGRHSAVPGDGLVPFHKLSQWLAYSLVEPLTAAGLRVTELDGLTGLAEYRNGGLFIDCGVIEPHDRALLRRPLDAQSEPVVEWRALTVALLDRLASRMRERLGKNAEEFPLTCVLEGGTWAAGREIALERRPDGSAPITIVSDGTLF
jgi:Protein of unknown function (DUF1688)